MPLDPVAFGQQWAQAWNAHDVEAVLQYFHDDVVFTSPVAAELLPEGIDTLVINYRNQNNALVNEVLKFNDDGMVVEGYGTYSIAAQGE